MGPRWGLVISLVLGLLCCSTAASAQLLFSGGEDIDFTCAGSGQCTVQTFSAAHYRSAWARESLELAGSTLDPPSNRLATPTFTPNSTIWFHAQFCIDSCSDRTNTSNVQMLRFIDSAGNPTLIVRGTGTAGQIKVSSRTSSGTFTDLVTCPSAVNQPLTQIDLHINYGTSGEIAFYNNSVQVCDFTGNVTNGDGATTLDQVELASAGGTADWSEVIVATTDTRAMARFTANTVANGNSTGFSGTNVCSAIWSAAAFNDANYGYSGAANVLHECTVKNSVPPGVYSVLGLVMSARALVGSSGPQHFDFLTRVNGTDYPSADLGPTNSFSNLSNYIQATNPATGSAWSISDFQAAGLNVGEETKP